MRVKEVVVFGKVGGYSCYESLFIFRIRIRIFKKENDIFINVFIIKKEKEKVVSGVFGSLYFFLGGRTLGFCFLVRGFWVVSCDM